MAKLVDAAALEAVGPGLDNPYGPCGCKSCQGHHTFYVLLRESNVNGLALFPFVKRKLAVCKSAFCL